MPEVKGQAYQTAVVLQDFANPGNFRANPTLAAGDVTVDIDGGGFVNLLTLPTVTPAAGVRVSVVLAAAEMNGDIITVRFKDQTSPQEWAELVLVILTTAAASGGDTPGTTTLLARIPGAVQPQTGDGYALLNSLLAGGVFSVAALANAPGGGTDTPGTTILLGRIPGTVQPQSGDAFASLAAGVNVTRVNSIIVHGLGTAANPWGP